MLQQVQQLYVPVVTLSTKNDKILLEQLRKGFKKTIKWNIYRSEMTNQTENNNFNYLIDPTFTNDCLSCRLKMKMKTSFSKYFVPNVQIKDFNVLIDGKSFFDMPIKMAEKHTNKFLTLEKIMIAQQVIYWILSTFQNITN